MSIDPLWMVVGAGSIFVVSILAIVAVLLRGSAGQRQHSLGSAQSGSGRGSRGLGSRGLGSHGLGSRGGSGSRGYGSGSHLGSETRSEDSNQKFGERMIQAGLYRRNSMTYYMVTKIAFALVPIVIGTMAAVMQWVTYPQGLAAGAILAIAGTIVPSFWLDAKKRERQRNISRALPDALDVIVVCLEAGLSLRAAISRVGKELQSAHPLLAAELLIVEKEVQLGASGGQALKRFADRFDMEELRGLASVVLQADKFGASISQALRVHAEDMRVRRFQRAEEMAQKASVKLIFPTMIFIFPTLYVVLIGPAVIEISSFFETFGR